MMPDDPLDDQKPDQCENCDWETPFLTSYTLPMTGRLVWFCKVCLSSEMGNAMTSRMGDDGQRILRAMAWQTNYIVARMKENQETEST